MKTGNRRAGWKTGGQPHCRPGEDPRVSDYRSLLDLAAYIRSTDDDKRLAALLCETALRLTHAQDAAVYRFPRKNGKAVWLTRLAWQGEHALPERIPAREPHVELLAEHGKAVVQLTREGPFPKLLLRRNAASALAVYLEAARSARLVLVINSRVPYHFTGTHIELIEYLSRLIRTSRGETHG